MILSIDHVPSYTARKLAAFLEKYLILSNVDDEMLTTLEVILSGITVDVYEDAYEEGRNAGYDDGYEEGLTAEDSE